MTVERLEHILEVSKKIETLKQKKEELIENMKGKTKSPLIDFEYLSHMRVNILTILCQEYDTCIESLETEFKSL